MDGLYSPALPVDGVGHTPSRRQFIGAGVGFVSVSVDGIGEKGIAKPEDLVLIGPHRQLDVDALLRCGRRAFGPWIQGPNLFFNPLRRPKIAV